MTYKLIRGRLSTDPRSSQATVVYTLNNRPAVRWYMTEVLLPLELEWESLILNLISSRNQNEVDPSSKPFFQRAVAILFRDQA